MNHTVYIALGSNIGNRAAYLHAALDAMSSYSTMEETSHLYETIPMLVTDQPLFLNAVCKVSTSLSPTELLRALKQTEDSLGRTKSIRYGPRVIDLDILLYDDAIIDTPDLTIPHLRMPERDFVLAPLLDLDGGLKHPRLGPECAGALGQPEQADPAAGDADRREDVALGPAYPCDGHSQYHAGLILR